MTSKSIIDRIPRRLKEIATGIQKELGTSTRMDAYDSLADLGSTFFNLKKNKKGAVNDMIVISVVFLFFVLICGVYVIAMDGFNDVVQSSDADSFIKDKISSDNTQSKSWIDFAIVFLFFMLLMGILMINFFLQANVIFLVLYIGSVFFIGLFFTAIHNALSKFKDSLPIVFNSLPLTSFLIDYYYFVMILFYLLFFILLFAKPRGEGVGEL